MSPLPRPALRHACALAAAALFFPALALAQQAPQDAAPVDMAQLLQTLKTLRETHETQARANKQRAAQQAQSLASNPSGAAAAWEDAVKQLSGNPVPDPVHDALRESEAQNAARLHFQWMLITLQRANDTEVKDLLPRVIGHTKEVMALRTALDALQEKINREKDNVGGNKAKSKERVKDDETVKKTAEDILKANVMGGPVAQAWRISEMMNVPGWEGSAGDVDGIFKAVIIPEMERQRDVRVLEYWDMKLARERERAEKSKDPVQLEKFNTQTRLDILWEKAEEANKLGLRNRALGEMMLIIKSGAAHPRFGGWLRRLEEIVTPAPAAAPAATPAVAPAAR